MLPPEVNSGRMYSGPGAGPLLAASAAWSGLASELHTAGTGYEATITELAKAWSGPSATAMAAAAAPSLAWLHTAAIQAEQAATQARAAANAYETAFAMTVPPPVIAANRSQLAVLVATNFLGQNTPAIAATEAHYGQMWAQDAVAMYTYAASAAIASVLKPFAPPPNTANPAGAVAGQTLAAAAGQAQSAGAQLSALPSALHSLTAPAAAGPAPGPALPGALTSSLAADPGLGSAYLGLGISLLGSIVVDGIGTFGVDAVGTFVIDVGGAIIGAWEAGSLPVVGLASWSAPMTAGMGQAASIGALSVPVAWTSAVPSATSITTALTAGSTAAGPTFAALPFAPMAGAGMAGGATVAAGQAGSGTSRRPKQKRPEAPKAPPNAVAPKGPITSISGKLRRLAALRDVGILSQDKFIEKKRRLLDQHTAT